LNKVILVGALGKDPELRHTQSGMAIMEIRMATNERKKQGEEWIEATEWHTVVVFDKRAEGLSKVLAKGSWISVDGKIETSSYEKDGEKRYRTKIIANDVRLVGKRQQSDGGSAPAQARTAAPAASYAPPTATSDDDMPF